jgi:TolB-like protein/tetratricopeptide (TPR) repeat protein
MTDGKTARRQDGMMGFARRCVTAALALAVMRSCRLSALQCPDGAPPPCRSAARPAAPAPNSVAVLYFENATRDTNDAYLSDGITEEIISRLSGIERVTVRSRYLVRRYRGTVLDDPAAVGRALNVTYLVSGSVRRAGGRLRVNAELIRAAGGAQVWGRQFDQAGDDVFAIQEAVAREVATGIVGRLLPSENQTLAVRPTTSSAAYQAVLRGNYNLARRDSAGILQAVAEYESALRTDPAYTDALSRVGLAYGIASSNGYRIGLSSDTVTARAMRYASEAVRRAPNSSDAWTAMGSARLVDQPRVLTGVRDGLERAIVLDPSNAEPHHLLGFTLALLGQDSAGLGHDRMALAIEPARPVTIMHLAHFALKYGRAAESRRWVDSALVVNAAFMNARMFRAILLLLDGDTAQARADVARWRDQPPLRGYVPLYERILAPHAQDSASAREWRAGILSLVPAELPAAIASYTALMAMIATRDAETVLQVLSAAQPRGAFAHYFMTFPLFDPIRRDAGFQRLWQETAP